ncbi:MAG: hypothetical protein F6J89_12330 [Symploca sp. SIO1C4]|uniref:DNA mismatch repair protein MutS-like N-terminal domain-containing protein n=1 Tax=Symploca sp. SIO1C4 TaxID=2607765 RepID=A0A6B3N5H8_9CYAN|nr:hypothetical protein [Symploca sp. SIO1C4]
MLKNKKREKLSLADILEAKVSIETQNQNTSISCFKKYQEAKQQNPSTLVFVRVADFFETFGDDAATASNALELMLTNKIVNQKTGERVKMTGFPAHARERYESLISEQGYTALFLDKEGLPVTISPALVPVG